MSPRPRLSQEETREQRERLIEATFRAIAVTGDADPPVRRILRESDLSRQTFYRCFESKDDLMAAVRVEGRQILADYLRARMAREHTPGRQIRAWITGVMRQAEAPFAVERTRPFVVNPGGQAVGSEAEAAEKERLLCEPLEQALADQEADSTGRGWDATRSALIIHDFVMASLRRHLLMGISPTKNTVDALAEFALRAVGLQDVEVGR